ncbi:MAG: hypothetical protein IPP47_26125 [Bryobacterales bacterium]|nr:hypothetical protein [Bryobacterales bacterium]
MKLIPNISTSKLALLLATAALAPSQATAQEAPLLWDSTKLFQYNIHSAAFDSANRTVTVVFSVTNPQAAQEPYNIRSGAPPFQSPATLRVNVGWNAGTWGATELVNTGSNPGTTAMNNVIRNWMNFTPPNPGGVGPAYPNVVNALTAANPCTAAASVPVFPCA